MGTVKRRAITASIHHMQFELRPKRRSARYGGIGGAIAEWWVLAESRAEAADAACSMIEHDGWEVVAQREHEVQDVCPYCTQDERYAHYRRAQEYEYSFFLKTWPKEATGERVQ